MCWVWGFNVDFDYSDDQQMLMTAFDGLLEKYRQPPQGAHGYVAYSTDFQTELVDSGFVDIVSQEGFGILDGALLVEAAAACAPSVEIAASLLIGPLLSDRSGPFSIVDGFEKPARFLRQAATAIVFVDGKVWVGTPADKALRHVDSVVAYPLAALTALPDDAVLIDPSLADAIRRRAMIGLAAEASGLMRGALQHTVQYVKEREQFGQPLGHFQAIQHRLAEDAQLVRATRWLAFRAADGDDEEQAAVASLYAQEAMRKVINDCHQFTGAMGLTLEFPLHLWTYRLKYLQGELGGKPEQAQRVAELVWPGDAQRASDPLLHNQIIAGVSV